MSTTVGQIVLDVDADGRLLERRVRQIGRRGGAEAGKSFTKQWDKEISGITKSFRAKVMAKADMDAGEGGKKAGISFSDAFESSVRTRLNKITKTLVEALQSKGTFAKFAEESGGTREAIERLNLEMKELVDNGILTRGEMNKISFSAQQWAKSIDKNTAAHRALSVELEQQNEIVKRAQEEYAESIRLQKDEERALNSLLTAKEKQALLLEKNEGLQAKLNERREQAARASRRFGIALGGANIELGKMNLSLDKADKGGNKFFSRWKTLPRGFRRFAFFTALFASLAEEIAVLGSAAGSSIAVLAGSVQQLLSAASAGATILLGAIFAGGVGFATLITAFRGFTGELSELPPKARAAAQAFRDFGEVLGDIRLEIQERFFDGIAGPLENLFGELGPRLKEGLGAIADELNTVFLDLIGRLSSERGLGNLVTIFEIIRDVTAPLFTSILNFGSALAEVFIISGPSVERFAEYLERITAQFERFTQSEEGRDSILRWLERGEETLKGFLDGVLDLGGALGNIFDAGRPQIDAFNKYLGDILEDFNEWTGSLEGQNALQEWFENGQRVVVAVRDFVVELSKVLDRLVDEEAIRRIEELFANLTKALPGIEALLGVLAELNIFGVIAETLNSLFTILEPIFSALEPIASIVSDLVMGFSTWNAVLAPFLTLVLAPMRLLFETLAIVVGALSEAFRPLTDAFAAASTVINDTLNEAIIQIAESFAGLILDLLGVETGTGSFIDFMTTNLVPLVNDRIVPAIKDFADGVTVVVDEFRTNMLPYIRDTLMPFIVNTLIPEIKNTIGIFSAWQTGIDRLMGRLRPLVDLARDVARALGLIPDVSGAIRLNDPQRRLPRAATGGIATQRTIAGEAGAEVIIPLTRPLSQVDPSVRELAAIARGMYGTAGRFGGPSGQRNGGYVAPGAITVVSPYADPRNVAVAALDELVEMMG